MPGKQAFPRNTIKEYFRTIKSSELNLEDPLGLEDLRIEHILRAPLKTERERREDFMLRLEKLYHKLKHPHITKQLLHFQESTLKDYGLVNQSGLSDRHVGRIPGLQQSNWNSQSGDL